MCRVAANTNGYFYDLVIIKVKRINDHLTVLTSHYKEVRKHCGRLHPL
jgi:hypothetical protein